MLAPPQTPSVAPLFVPANSPSLELPGLLVNSAALVYSYPLAITHLFPPTILDISLLPAQSPLLQPSVFLNTANQLQRTPYSQYLCCHPNILPRYSTLAHLQNMATATIVHHRSLFSYANRTPASVANGLIFTSTSTPQPPMPTTRPQHTVSPPSFPNPIPPPI
jgi:hypothetical protein